MTNHLSLVTDHSTALVVRCFHCGDLGFVLGTDGLVSTCWRQRAGAPHNAPSAAALLIERACRSLMIEKLPIDQHCFHVAKTLTQYATDRPCDRDWLIDAHFRHTRSSLRSLASTIERLRSVWLMPIGSRKEEPSGYWIITDADDFAAWVTHAKAAPVTQLTTIHRVAKRNFPIFAEQMEFDFWNNIEPQQMDAAA